MTPERYQKISKLVHAALELEPQPRKVFLDAACAGDEELRREVESLIASDEEADGLFATPALEVAAGMMAEQQAALAAGQQIGHYQIISLLGAGGMGTVYRAKDTRLKREVAIKVLPAEFAKDADRLRRFEQEARATSSLNHPNILIVHDIGTHEGSPYIVSELLEGETLHERIEQGALPARKASDLALQMARGLAAAHERGIVHRDLKPENLFVTRDGRIKILDFGLAKLKPPKIGGKVDTEAPTSVPQTDPGVIMGTIGYMSPEQVRGQDADHRSDIFAFGAILYEMLTGKRAFWGETAAETMTAILKAEPPELSETNPNLAPGLERVVRHCLEKKAEERFQSTNDLGFAIASLLGVSGPSKSEVVVAPVPIKRLPSTLLASFGFALLAVGAVAGIFADRTFWKTSPPAYQRLTLSRGTIWNARFAPDGQTILYSARWNGQPLDVFAGRAGKTESRSLKLENTDVLAISAAGEMAVLHNSQPLSWYLGRGTLARMPVDGGAARDLLTDVQEADFSPDGTKLVVVRWVNGRNQLEYPVGKVLYETAGYITHPRISPKGDLIAFMDHQVQWDNRGWVAVVDLSGKKTVLSGEWGGEEGLAWSPAGDEVWFTATKSGEADALYAVTPSGRERLVVRMASRLMLHDIARDGRMLLASFNNSTSFIGQAPGERKERDLSWVDYAVLSDLSPDGKTILFAHSGEGSGINYAVYLCRTDGSPAVRLGDGAMPRLSPDGKWALAVLHTPPQLALLPTGAGEVKQLERGPIGQYSEGASWFPDGKRVVFQGRESGHNWRLYMQSIGGSPPRPITPEGTTGSIRGILISPDSRLVIASDAERQQAFYPVEGGAPQPISHLEHGDQIIGWSSDGRSLYLARTQELPARVYRFDPSTGHKELLREIMPADAAGIISSIIIRMTPDGKGYVYSVRRNLSDLYLVEGLK